MLSFKQQMLHLKATHSLTHTPM